MPTGWGLSWASETHTPRAFPCASRRKRKTAPERRRCVTSVFAVYLEGLLASWTQNPRPRDSDQGPRETKLWVTGKEPRARGRWGFRRAAGLLPEVWASAPAQLKRKTYGGCTFAVRILTLAVPNRSAKTDCECTLKPASQLEVDLRHGSRRKEQRIAMKDNEALESNCDDDQIKAASIRFRAGCRVSTKIQRTK
jgi:hypothetical protein